MILLLSIAWAILLASVPVHTLLAVEPGPTPGRVLFLNSYHPGLEWGDNLYNGFLSTVGDSVEVYPEYLDTKRFVGTEHYDAFLVFLEAKYHDRGIDVVVVSDDAAYRLAIERPIPLLEGVPIVFCGVNEYSPSDYTDDQITGIAEITAIGETLDLIFDLHPQLTRMIAVTDNTLNGRTHAREIGEYAERHPLGDRIVIPNLSGDATLDTYAALITETGKGAVVYYSDYFVDPDGTAVTADEAFDRFRSAGDPPVYGHVGTYLANGLLGGGLTLPEEQGALAGQYVGRILGGEPVTALPVHTDGPANYIFNAPLLARYGIRRSALPPNHLLVGTLRERVSEPGFLRRTTILLVIGLFFLLTAAIAIIVVRARTARQLSYERELFQALLDESPDLIFYKDREGQFIRTNRAHDEQIGIPPGESSVGRSDNDFYPAPLVREQREIEDRIIATGVASNDNLEHHVSANGQDRWMLCTKMPHRSVTGEIIGIVGLSREVTGEIVAKDQLTAALEEREILLKEIHHRIKNNMQLISSILNLQKDQVYDASVHEALEEAQLRVYTMAMVHEHLYQGASIARLDLGEYLNAVLLYVLGFVRSGLTIEHRVQADSFFVEPETAIHIGLIVSELLSNAVKHAFPDRSHGLIELTLARGVEHVTLTVRDDGVGIPDEYDPETTESMGMQIVTALVRQLNGTLRMYADDGTVSKIALPLPETSEPTA